MTTIRRLTISIAILAVFALAAVLVVREADNTANADEGPKFIGLWQTIQSSSDGALQTLSISDIERDEMFEIGVHESGFTSCGGDFGVAGGTGIVSEEGILIVDLTVTCTNGDVVFLTGIPYEHINKHDQLVNRRASGDVYHRISRR